MGEAKKYCDKLVDSVGNMVSAEQKEEIRKKAESLANKTTEGMDQLKDEIMKAAKKGSEESKQKAESAWNEFETNIKDMQKKQSQKVSDKLGSLIDQIKQSDWDKTVKDEISKKAEKLRNSVGQQADSISKDMADQITELNNTVKTEATKKKDQTMTKLVDELSKLISSPSKS